MKILVPSLGESVTEATVAKWLKKTGETVSKDEVLVELETENFDAAEALLKRAIILQNDSQISMDSLENNDGKSIHLRVSESHEGSIQTLIERNLERVKQERLEKTGQT